ncbi:MAG: BON domain-containing protein [Rhodothermales bacterium]
MSQRLRDASLAAEIQLALMDERALRAFRFDPVVVDGQVLLQGNVETLDQRERAASVAASVPGVQDVINEVTSTESPVAATP